MAAVNCLLTNIIQNILFYLITGLCMCFNFIYYLSLYLTSEWSQSKKSYFLVAVL